MAEATQGPIDPSLIMPAKRLPDRGWRDMWARAKAVFRGRIYEKDFHLTFDAVHAWLDGREITINQARWSAHDMAVVMCGVAPLVIIQKCESSGVIMLTMIVRAANGDQEISRTKTVNLIDPGGKAAARSRRIAKTKDLAER